MRKFGKYEKMPDGTKAKQPAAKSVLLQTYFTSLICMVLCVAMFFGTTFAWFTSDWVSGIVPNTRGGLSEPVVVR